MGLRRKAALFIHLAALLCGECENWHTAHELGRIAAQGYGVQCKYVTAVLLCAAAYRQQSPELQKNA
eukprot:7530-Heterococcus_DN1.PRE.2